MLPAARHMYPGVASWCQMDFKVLFGEGEQRSLLRWNVGALRLSQRPTLSRYLGICGMNVAQRSRF